MAFTESVTAINEMSRHGGFALVARFPRRPATFGDEAERLDIGAMQGFQDGPTGVAVQAKYRQERNRVREVGLRQQNPKRYSQESDSCARTI